MGLDETVTLDPTGATRDALLACMAPAGWAVVAAATLAAVPPASAAERPNVLLLLADDFPRNLIAAYGSPSGLTPTLDALATNGLAFTRAYTPHCSTPERTRDLQSSLASSQPAAISRGLRRRCWRRWCG